MPTYVAPKRELTGGPRVIDVEDHGCGVRGLQRAHEVQGARSTHPELMDPGLVVPHPQRDVEVRAELEVAGFDRPFFGWKTRSRFFSKVKVYDRVSGGLPSRRRRAWRGTVRNHLGPRSEHDDLPVHLRVAEAAELRALHGVRSRDVRADPEDVRDPGDRVDLDPEIGHVE